MISHLFYSDFRKHWFPWQFGARNFRQWNYPTSRANPNLSGFQFQTNINFQCCQTNYLDSINFEINQLSGVSWNWHLFTTTHSKIYIFIKSSKVCRREPKFAWLILAQVLISICMSWLMLVWFTCFSITRLLKLTKRAIER